MWKVDKIKATNWLAFKELEYEPKSGETVLIQGINNADDGAESNGSGKSSIQEAIFYAIIGNSSRKKRDVELVNDNAKESELYISLSNKVLDTQLEINRTIKRKGSATIQIRIDEVDQSIRFPTVNDGNKLIIQTLGISTDDIVNYYIINKEKWTSFLTSSDTKKKELITRFSKLGKIDIAIEKVSADITSATIKKASQQSEIDRIIGRMEAAKTMLEREKLITPESLKEAAILGYKNDVLAYRGEIDRLKLDMERSKNVLRGYPNVILQNKNKLEALTVELGKLDSKKWQDQLDSMKGLDSEYTKQIGGRNADQQKLAKSIREYESMLNEILKTIQNSIECPKCQHEFVLNSNLSVSDAKDNKPIVEIAIQQEKDKKTALFTEISELETKISEINGLRNQTQQEITKIESKRYNKQREITEVSRQIETDERAASDLEKGVESTAKKVVDKEALISETNKQIEDVKSRDFNNRVSEFEEQIKVVESEKTEKEKLLAETEHEVFELEKWKFNFQKFKSHLINKNLKSIQSLTNEYLGKMKTNLSIELSGYKTLSTGKTKESIDIQVRRNGAIEGSYGRFSGGERGKIDFAVILAIQSLINITSASGGLDLLFTDEITESIDPLGIDNLVKSVSELRKTVFITTHVPYNYNYGKVLTVTKELDYSHAR